MKKKFNSLKECQQYLKKKGIYGYPHWYIYVARQKTFGQKVLLFEWTMNNQESVIVEHSLS